MSRSSGHWCILCPLVRMVPRGRVDNIGGGSHRGSTPFRRLLALAPLASGFHQCSFWRKRMPKRKPKKVRVTSSLPTIHLNAAAVDIGSEEHWVAVPGDRDSKPVRRFTAFTDDLYA